MRRDKTFRFFHQSSDRSAAVAARLRSFCRRPAGIFSCCEMFAGFTSSAAGVEYGVSAAPSPSHWMLFVTMSSVRKVAMR